MNWHDEPISAPWTCSLCGSGAERRLEVGPFLVTDWTYESVSGAEYVDKLAAGNMRFTICRMCIVSSVVMLTKYDFSYKDVIAKAIGIAPTLEPETERPPLVIETDEHTGQLVAALMAALDDRDRAKADARMAKARAAKAAKKAS